MKQSPFDQLVQAFAHAVTDIREKVVEEPWFGRPVGQHHHEGGDMASFYGKDHGAHAAEVSPWDRACDHATQAHQPSLERELDRDIDR